jgi:hypothetical protein
MPPKIAKVISLILHPVLVPTLAFLLLFNSGFYISMLSWEAKRVILLVIFFSTSVLPMLSVAILTLNPRYNLGMPNAKDRVIPLVSASVFYYMGFLLLNKMNALPLFKLFLIASVLVIAALLLISIKWKISIHMASLGGVTGTFFALGFRYGLNPLYILLTLVLISGLLGTAQMSLNKHSVWQILAGYVLGFAVLYLTVYFI